MHVEFRNTVISENYQLQSCIQKKIRERPIEHSENKIVMCIENEVGPGVL